MHLVKKKLVSVKRNEIDAMASQFSWFTSNGEFIGDGQKKKSPHGRQITKGKPGGKANEINEYLIDFLSSQDVTQDYFIERSPHKSKLTRGYSKNFLVLSAFPILRGLRHQAMKSALQKLRKNKSMGLVFI